MSDEKVKCCVVGCTRLVPQDIEICRPCFKGYLKLLRAIKAAALPIMEPYNEA